jgi:flagellar motor protein MotB
LEQGADGDDHAARDKKHGEAVAKALTSAGATKTQVEQAGARTPVVDPSDAKHRERNARVEIVFVSGG